MSQPSFEQFAAIRLIGSVKYSPDGTEMAYTANTTGFHNIWVMPVVLAVQSSQSGFANAVVKMAWHLGEPFILLAPTNRFLDANAKATLQKARAGFFALDNILQVGANGLYAPKSAGELFSNYLPDSGHAVEEDVARQLFALVEQLESETSWRKAPILQVFRLYCRENLTRDEVAKECGCVPSLISLRLKQIEERLGRKRSELRQFSSHFEKMEDSMSDSRARKIDRRAAFHLYVGNLPKPIEIKIKPPNTIRLGKQGAVHCVHEWLSARGFKPSVKA